MKSIYKGFLLAMATLFLVSCGKEETSAVEELKSMPEEPVQEAEPQVIAATENILDAYSTEEIEFARIWLQLGPNPDVEEIYVEHIPAGTPVNALDEGSLSYPEDVVRLSGLRLVDGVITYSGNGDGTINVYNVPARWEDPSTYKNDSSIMEEETRKIIENTEMIYVEPGNPEEVAEMANRIK